MGCFGCLALEHPSYWTGVEGVDRIHQEGQEGADSSSSLLAARIWIVATLNLEEMMLKFLCKKLA